MPPEQFFRFSLEPQVRLGNDHPGSRDGQALPRRLRVDGRRPRDRAGAGLERAAEGDVRPGDLPEEVGKPALSVLSQASGPMAHTTCQLLSVARR